MKSRIVLTMLLVSLLSPVLTLPMIPLASSSVTTLTINAPTLPAGHTTHIPLLDTGFWLNTGTLESPMWTYYPWGSTVNPTPGTSDEFDIIVAAQIRDSLGGEQTTGHVHSFQIAEWPGTTIILGPEGEEAHGEIQVPTHHWRLSVADSATTTPALKRAGPEIEVLQMPIIRAHDDRLIAMQSGQAHVWTDLIRHGDIEALAAAGFTVTSDAGFHMGYIGFNIRPLSQQWADPDHTIPRRTDTTIWPLADVAFRHALFHCYDQETMLASTFGYTVTAMQSLVPPALGGWVNPGLRTHPYNPGNPFTSVAGEHSSCGILKAAGYVFVDADSSGTVTRADYWTIGGVKMPHMKLWTSTMECGFSNPLGNWFIADLKKIGLAATVWNGFSGLEHYPAEFAEYIDKVYSGLFDAFMLFWSLGRFPDYLYSLCHSSQICGPAPDEKGLGNAPGINDPEIDAAVETIMFSLNNVDRLAATYEAQERLYDPEVCDQALAYMPLYSRTYFNAFNPDLEGIIKSPGFGSNNEWTLLNIRWTLGTERYTPDERTLLKWILLETPVNLNPFSGTRYSWDIMSRTIDGLLDMNPYNHEDVGAIAYDWDIVATPTGPGAMEITFHLRRGVFWQDGKPYTADDAKFNWMFLKNNQIPVYADTWQPIQNVVVIDDYTVKVVLSETSQYVSYYLAETAAMLPPPVWSWLDGKPLTQILSYSPSTNTTKPTDAGPWFGTPQGPKTQLYGTGAFVFDYYDQAGQIAQLHQFSGYFRNSDNIHAQKVEMFWAAGDVNRDGTVWADDLGRVGVQFGRFWFEPEYDPDCDFNQDGVIDIFDLSTVSFHFGEQRENP